ncbi:hypothetical protein HT031_003042 [Scenedesmus sp. PABB004]|nr:hypothetical protein HT031_003042 [Scenedesmus sp. PABB004]
MRSAPALARLGAQLQLLHARNFAAGAASTAKSTFAVPEGHHGSDLSSAACHIGLGRRRDLTMRQDLKLWDGAQALTLADVFHNCKTLLVGFPGGKICTEQHVPGYAQSAAELKAAGVDKVVCVTVAQPDGVQRWAAQHGFDKPAHLQVLADPKSSFVRLLGLELGPDGPPCQRFAAVVDNGILLRLSRLRHPSTMRFAQLSSEVSAHALPEVAAHVAYAVTPRPARTAPRHAGDPGAGADPPAALAELRHAVSARASLLTGGDDGWEAAAWATPDSEVLRDAAEAAAAALADVTRDEPGAVAAAAAAVAAAVAGDGGRWLPQLCELAGSVRAAWGGLAGELKARDAAPLQLAAAVGLVLARLHRAAARVASGTGAPAAQAGALLRCLCACQGGLHEALAAHAFILRWHEQQADTGGAGEQVDALLLRAPRGAADGAEAPPEPARHAPRLLAGGDVPAAHRRWQPRFLLPLLPASGHWRGGRELLAAWAALAERASSLGVPLVATPDAVCLVVEALWLFGQPAGGYLPAAWAGAPAADCDGDDDDDAHLVALWASLLPRLIASLEAEAPPAGVVERLVVACGPTLLGMLGEALQRLGRADGAVTRAALVRCVLDASDAPLLARQRRSAALLGKARPKPGEAVPAELMALAQGLASAVGELLRLERAACGGGAAPGDGGGGEDGGAVWVGALWRASPRGLCALLELLLRSPVPPAAPLAGLTEQLLGGLWAAVRAGPLLEEHGTARAAAAAIVSSLKAARCWQAAAARALALVGADAGAAARRGRQQGKGGARGRQPGKAAGATAVVAGGGEGAPAPPAWMLAAAAADSQAALCAGLALLACCLACTHETLDWRRRVCAAQQRAAAPAPADGVADGPGLSSSLGSESVWSSGSFLTSSDDDEDEDGDADADEAANAAIEAASSCGASSDGLSSCGSPPRAAPGCALARAAARAAPAAPPLPPPCAPGSHWGDVAVQLALGAAAQAGGAFALLGGAAAGQADGALALLERVSAGLAATAVSLAELARLGLLPELAPGAPAAEGAVRAALADILAGGARGGGRRAAAPPAGAPADAHRAWRARLAPSGAQQLHLAAALSAVSRQPAGPAAVGCHHPGCCELAGESERRLATRACRACRAAAYCSPACQAADWRAGHRAQCAHLQAAAQAEWLLAGGEGDDDEGEREEGRAQF